MKLILTIPDEAIDSLIGKGEVLSVEDFAEQEADDLTEDLGQVTGLPLVSCQVHWMLDEKPRSKPPGSPGRRQRRSPRAKPRKP